MGTVEALATAPFDPPVLRSGFRPFFLLAATWAAVVLPLWALALTGRGAPALSPSWHGHAMLSGFTFAIIAGFLLTAVRNWTGHETARGTSLGVLAALWVGGRIAGLTGATGLVEGLFDGLLMFGVFLAVLRAIVASGDRRNAPFCVPLVLFGGLDAVVHAQPERASWALARELDLVVLLMVVITGRIVPTFTQNALPQQVIRRAPRMDGAARVLTFLMVIAGLLDVPAFVPGVLGALAGLAVLLRARGWQTTRTVSNPLLFVLHVGHAWLGVGLVLRGLVPVFDLPASLGVHALTVGAVGTLTLGMMTRVALGHTGRPLRAPPLAVAGYTMVTLAAVLRLQAAILPTVVMWASASLAMSLAFGLYLVHYAPILWNPRVDGAPE